MTRSPPTPNAGPRWWRRRTIPAQVTTLLDDAGINYLSVTARTKSVASFAAKADRTVDGRASTPTRWRRSPIRSGCGSSPFCATTSHGGEPARRRDAAARRPRHGQETAARAAGVTPAGTCSSPSRASSSPRPSRCGPSFSTRGPSSSTTSATRARSPRTTPPTWTGASPWRQVCWNWPTASSRRSANGCGPRRPQRSEQPEPDSDPRIATPVLATYLGNRFPDAGWSRTEHYAWISGLLLDLGIESLEGLWTQSSIRRRRGDQHQHGLPLSGRVRCAAWTMCCLPVFGGSYIELAWKSHRIALLENRFETSTGTLLVGARVQIWGPEMPASLMPT